MIQKRSPDIANEQLHWQAFLQRSDGIWLLMLENCAVASNMMRTEKRTFESLIKFSEKEVLDPTTSDVACKIIQSMFVWDN